MLVRRAVGSDIDVTFDLARGLWCCRVDPNQLESAILNLAINARDAMPKGGSLTISTENIGLDAEAARELGEMEPGRYVSVALADTGAGMPQDVLARVFEPFFTTKEVGKGSGLGLSQVYGFARQSGGHITVHSEVGRGTKVRLYLPWTAPAEAAVVKEAEAIGAREPGLSKVLIVEDNDELRELTTQLVQGLGYAACSASAGAEAIAALARDPTIDLLFTDVLMPGGMNGFELAAEIRRRRPEIAILMTSGFPGNFLPGVQQDSDFEIIRKPFTQAELRAAFARVRVAAMEPK
jgi:CheY-like chemotaxis protein